MLLIIRYGVATMASAGPGYVSCQQAYARGHAHVQKTFCRTPDRSRRKRELYWKRAGTVQQFGTEQDILARSPSRRARRSILPELLCQQLDPAGASGPAGLECAD